MILATYAVFGVIRSPSRLPLVLLLLLASVIHFARGQKGTHQVRQRTGGVCCYLISSPLRLSQLHHKTNRPSLRDCHKRPCSSIPSKTFLIDYHTLTTLSRRQVSLRNPSSPRCLIHGHRLMRRTPLFSTLAMKPNRINPLLSPTHLSSTALNLYLLWRRSSLSWF